MRRHNMVTKGLAAALVLVMLLRIASAIGSLRRDDTVEPLPHKTAAILAEVGSGVQGVAVQTPPEEPTKEPEQPTEQSSPPEEPTEQASPQEEPKPTDSQTDTSAQPDTGNRTDYGETGDTPGKDNLPDGGNDNGQNKNPDDNTNNGSNNNDDNNNDHPPDKDTQLRIVTDLTNGMFNYEQLEDDILPFYAYIVNGKSDMYLRAKLRNTQTPANGQFLTAQGRNFEAKLARQEDNYITLYVKQGSKTVLEVTYTIRYEAQKADANKPQVGDSPPVVQTNLDGFTGTLTNRNFTLTVDAKTTTGQRIFADNIFVTLDGQPVSGPTGSQVFEYALYFENPTVGDSQTHEITVLAWDNAGNSTFVRYEVTYSFVDTGGTVGTAYILLDATTVGLDPDTLGGTYVWKIRQNVPASYAVLEMLEEFGYDVEYANSPDDGFYLRRISRGGMMDYAQIPDALWQKIQKDGLGLTGQSSADSLGEFDYTNGSGWMYSLNGTLYAGKGLSGYYLSDGDTLYIRFTLAYGKDIGGYNDGYGTLSTYCGKWLNGTYFDEHQWGEESVVQEPTCMEPGVLARTCAVCGDQQVTGSVPALGHDFVETDRQEPTQTEEGWIDYTCTRCGATKRETLTVVDTNWRRKHERTTR